MEKGRKRTVYDIYQFSRRNFESGGKNFAGRLKRMADHYGIDPKYIEVEVTESVVVENVDELKGCFQNLKIRFPHCDR